MTLLKGKTVQQFQRATTQRTLALLCVTGGTAALVVAEPALSAPALSAPAMLAGSTDAYLSSPSLVHKTATSKKSFAIVAKVGDLVITNHQVDARSTLLLQGSPAVGKYFKDNIQNRWKSLAGSETFRKKLSEYVKSKRPTTREEANKYAKEYAISRQQSLAKIVRGEAVANARKGVKDNALKDLIDERLKLYEAQRMNVAISEDRVKEIFADIAKKNNKSVPEFETHLRKSGVSPNTLRDKIRADQSWAAVIRKQFGFQLHMMQSNLDRYMGQSEGDGSGDAMLDVKKMILTSSGGASDLAMNIKQAEALRGSIDGCDSLARTASQVAGSRIEDVGKKRASEIAEPMRTLLQNAKDGELLPPQIGTGGSVELWVLCGRSSAPGQTAQAGAGRKTSSSIDEQRQNEFQILAKRHLNDLRREVPIEYR